MRRLTIFLTFLAALGTTAPAAADTEVVGGERAAPGEFPWMVHLSMGCGGALVAPQVILTAAHCVPKTGPNTTITALLGTTDLADPEAAKVRSTHVYRPAEYVNFDHGHDWALISLAEPVDLPTVGLVSGQRQEGAFTVMGWGADREGGAGQRWLMKAQVPVVADELCATAYRASGANFVEDAMICAGLFGTGGVDTCQGDSGGPMVTTAPDGTFVQVGIVSWGHGCAQPNFPGVYTQLSTYTTQITEALTKLPPTDGQPADSENGMFTEP